MADHQHGRGADRSFVSRVTGEVTGRVVQAVDPDAVLAEIDVDALMQRIDIQRVLDRVDPDALLDRVDTDRLLDRVDPNRLLDRVDPDRLLDRVDPDRLLDRVDPDRLLSRVDVEALLAQVDLEALVRRSGVPDIVAESTNQLAGRGVDLARRQLVALDVVLDRLVDGVLRRDRDEQPAGPPALVGANEHRSDSRRMAVTGFYTGAVTRAVSAGLDAAAIIFSFTLGVAGLDYLARVFLGLSIPTNGASPVAIGALLLWAWFYTFGSLAVAGRTPGKGAVGIRVVSREGGTLTVPEAFERTLALPFSLLCFGLGVLMILVQKEQRALHDLIGRTAVVYDWGERAAELPGPLSAFLQRRAG